MSDLQIYDEKRIPPELRRKIGQVTGQYRRHRAMRALARFGATTFVLTCAFTLLFYLLRHVGEASTILLGGYLLAEFVAFLIMLVLPLHRKVSLRQMALYIDEHHPELENRVISAVDFTMENRDETSSWLVSQFLMDTVPRVRRTRLTDLFGSRESRGSRWAFGTMILLSLVVMGTFNRLWLPSIGFALPEVIVKEIMALPFSVEPGNVKVRQGDNQMVLVKTQDVSRAVTILWREGNGVWQQQEASQSSSENVRFRQFTNIQTDIQYQVGLGDKRSDVYQIAMWVPPSVETINLTYTYPDYTQMYPREELNSGNITALEGTKVDVSVVANKQLSSAEMVLESGTRIPLSSVDNVVWTTPIILEKSDKYRIELVDLDEDGSEYNPEYKIAVLRDKAPEIDIDFPRGDNEVTLLEELTFDFSVTDDYGFAEYGLQYEVAGKDPVRISLNDTEDLQQASEGHHDIALEDMNLEVGDFITWTVWAKDTNPARGEYEELGDPFFFEIRPFKMLYKETMSDAGSGSGGGGGGDEAGELGQLQKEILIATWNLRREAKYMIYDEYQEKKDIILDSQNKAQGMAAEQAGPSAPPEVGMLIEAMQGSIDALKKSDMPEPKQDLSKATTHQQMASRLIAKLKGREAEVQQEQESSGGGGGGGGERPDISDLEMARNKNFYEEEQATQEQQAQTDAVLEKIKELAHRQEGVNEELAKLISELQTAKTEEELEDIQRKLEQLEEQLKENLQKADEARRELSSESLSNEQAREALDALDNARHQMERTLEQMRKQELQKARSAGQRAMNALTDMQEALQQFSREMAAKRMDELLEQMEQLEGDQQSILDQTAESLEKHENPNMDNTDEMEGGKEDILNQKTELAESFVELMDTASELAERGQQTQELMSRKLGDWLRETSGKGILEDIEETQDLVRYEIWESALEEEAAIGEKIRDAKERLAEVASAATKDDLEGMQKALGQLDELMEGESMQAARAVEGDQPGVPGEEAEQGAEGQMGQQGEEGEQGQEGEEGQQGQMAQAGQEGDQPGEQGQEGQQGQQGQQGQEGQEGQEGQQGDGSGEGQGREQSAQQQGSQNNGSRQGGNQNGGDQLSGGSIDGTGGTMENFANSESRQWLEQLRNAEALLSEDSPVRRYVGEIRENVERIRSDWRNRKKPPQFELFLDVAARPLMDATEQLQREIQKELNANEFILVDDGDIPERYKGRVAQYFKDLSEAETREAR